MSNLRPECRSYYGSVPALPRDTALFLIRDAVARRRVLIHGQLHHGNRHCALGAFWNDNPDCVLSNALIQEVAAVNDSLPAGATQQDRWRKVSGWLRFKIKSLANS